MANEDQAKKQQVISHRTRFGKAFYDQGGIKLLTGFGREEIAIPWREIEFCSFTPAVKLFEGKWKDFKGKDLDKLNFLILRIVLKDRHQILQATHLLSRFWLKSILHLKPLFTANDKPHPQKGILTLEVNLKSLSINREDFVEFVSNNSRFDLLVFE